MTRFSAYTAVLASVASAVSGHMIMQTPAPFGNPDNSPLSSDGSNFPCKVQGDAASFYSFSKATEMQAGSTQKLSFKGSAVHGGGSCQLAITNDKQPTASSSWSVILSLEGGCPSKDGSGPSEYDFTIPEDVPAGEYVFAWTWISKMSGAPEYYMNCAPIKVTGGSSKRSIEERAAGLSAMPNLFVANLASVNDCKSRDGGSSVDVKFPEPGPNVEKPNPNPNFGDPIGDNCFPKGASAEGVLAGGGGGSTGGGDAAPPAQPDGGSSGGSPSASASAPAAPSTTSAPAEKPSASVPGGVFVTAPGNGGGAAPSAAPTATASSASAPASSASAPAAPSATAPSSPGSGSGSGSGSGAGSGSGSSQGAMSGPCKEEGQFNCVNNQFQQCASGTWTAMQPMAAGTSCQAGLSATLWAAGRRSLRYARRAL